MSVCKAVSEACAQIEAACAEITRAFEGTSYVFPARGILCILDEARNQAAANGAPPAEDPDGVEVESVGA